MLPSVNETPQMITSKENITGWIDLKNTNNKSAVTKKATPKKKVISLDIFLAMVVLINGNPE
jgi:hypothetical protein